MIDLAVALGAGRVEMAHAHIMAGDPQPAALMPTRSRCTRHAPRRGARERCAARS